MLHILSSTKKKCTAYRKDSKKTEKRIFEFENVSQIFKQSYIDKVHQRLNKKKKIFTSQKKKIKIIFSVFFYHLLSEYFVCAAEPLTVYMFIQLIIEIQRIPIRSDAIPLFSSVVVCWTKYWNSRAIDWLYRRKKHWGQQQQQEKNNVHRSRAHLTWEKDNIFGNWF